VQGFLIARPAPLDEIAAFIPETTARMAAVWPAGTARARDDMTGETSSVTFLRPRPR